MATDELIEKKTPENQQGTTASTPSTTGGAGTTGATGSAANYNNNIINGAYNTARTEAINRMYDAQKASREAELRSAYDQSMSSYREAQGKIAPQYQQSANDLSTQYEKSRQAFQRQAMANGLNTGTGAQEALARYGQYQRDLSRIRTSEAEAQAAVERQMADRKTQYQGDIAAAIAQNDYQRAGALLDEYNNGYKRDLDNAKLLASYGDFSFFQNLYGKEQADNMYNFWLVQNPDLAHNVGKLTDDQYDNIKHGKDMNDGLDENGNRVRRNGVGGSSGGWGGPNYYSRRESVDARYGDGTWDSWKDAYPSISDDDLYLDITGGKYI